MKALSHQVQEAREPYTVDETAVINHALAILDRRMREPGELLNNSTLVRQYLRLAMHGLPHERFDVLYLDVQYRLIAHETAFTGSLCETQVHTRELVKAALKHNCAAAFVVHNHPSGSRMPSPADDRVTEMIKAAFNLIGVRLLDHFIVTDREPIFSFAEGGRM